MCFSVSVLIFVNFVSANFSLGNPPYYIEKEYKPGEYLKGWINISFLGHDYNEIFNDNFGNRVFLSEIIDLNSQYNFNETNETISSDMQILFLKPKLYDSEYSRKPYSSN
jgi:hypothetical protein